MMRLTTCKCKCMYVCGATGTCLAVANKCARCVRKAGAVAAKQRRSRQTSTDADTAKQQAAHLVRMCSHYQPLDVIHYGAHVLALLVSSGNVSSPLAVQQHYMQIYPCRSTCTGTCSACCASSPLCPSWHTVSPEACAAQHAAAKRLPNS